MLRESTQEVLVKSCTWKVKKGRSTTFRVERLKVKTLVGFFGETKIPRVHQFSPGGLIRGIKFDLKLNT